MIFISISFVKTSEIKISFLDKCGVADIQTQRDQTRFYRECLFFRSLCNPTKDIQLDPFFSVCTPVR